MCNLQTHREPDVYVKTVLTFGDKQAPAMAQIALRKTAEEAKEAFPVAAQVIQNNTYMDDICDSVLTKEEARDLTRDIDSVLETGGFRVKGWVSNKAETLDVPKGEQKAATFLQGGSVEKVLGVVWDSSTDTFSFPVKSDLLDCQEPIQLPKRRVLSQIARIYDPIGFSSAFNISAKIALQVELQGAVLASRLGKTIRKESRLKFEESMFFLDSKIVLAWICSETRRFRPFVSVRVGEIQDNLDPAQWRHVPGDQNVANDVLRGVPVERLNGRWQYGPDFLRLPESEWPQDPSVADKVEVETEHRKVHIVGEQIKAHSPIDCDKFSS